MLLCAWLAVGLAVGLRGQRAPWERALAVAFWPFFLLVPAGGGVLQAGSVERLRAALAPDDPAQALVDNLERALRRQQARVARLEEAVGRAGEVEGDGPELVAARRRSLALLVAARDRERAAVGAALAAVEETSTRLWLLRERGEPAEVDALLRGLAARLDADLEVDGVEAAGA